MSGSEAGGVGGAGGRLARLQASKAWRAWQRYGDVRGNVLAGGMAYFAFLSLFPALALGFTALGLVLSGDLELQRRIADNLNTSFGTAIISIADGDGGIVPLDQLVTGDVLSLVGIIGVVTLLFTGLGWIGAMRDGISAVFGRRDAPNVLVAKAADLGVLVAFGLVVLASFVGSVLVTATTGPVLDRLGLARSTVAATLVSVLTALVLLAIDTTLFLLLFRVLSGVRPLVDDVLTGALVGGVGMGLLKLGAGALLRFSSGNRFLAAFGIVLGLLAWMNLASRVTLLASAWAATTATDRGHLAVLTAQGPARDEATDGAVAEIPTSRAITSAGPVPTYSPRAADRTTLAAGAILGVTVAVGARALARAAAVLRPSRRDHANVP